MSSSSIPESVVILEPKVVCGEFNSPTITTLLLFLLIISKILLSITLGGGL